MYFKLLVKCPNFVFFTSSSLKIDAIVFTEYMTLTFLEKLIF